MLTPQEIEQKKFEKAVFGGYDMASVDDFLDALTADYNMLYRENVALKAKMKVLVEKIEEYRSVDDEMRKALLTAQKTAREIVDEAKKQAETLTSGARENAGENISALKQEIINEERRLEEARAATNGYIAELIDLHKNGIIRLQEFLVPQEKEPEQKPEIDEAKDAENTAAAEQPEPAERPGSTEPERPAPIKSAVETESRKENGMEVKVYEVKLPEKGKEYRDDTGEIMSYTPKPKFNFENLKFGKDYRESDD
ncbi:MAG: DivIVA domain-containing protein [Bacillota bacterium]|nr:DivIVA domain-containing protein [Bacillota bacterium]